MKKKVALAILFIGVFQTGVFQTGVFQTKVSQTLLWAAERPAVSPPKMRCSTGELRPGDPLRTTCTPAPIPAMVMPAGYGIHPERDLEWWYYVWNGLTPDGKRIGGMFSITRQDKVYTSLISAMGMGEGEYLQTQMVAKEVSVLPSVDPFGLNLMDGLGNYVSFRHDFRAKRLNVQATVTNLNKTIEIAFEADITKPGVLHGIAGYSPKSLKQPNVASYYYSEPRMEIRPESLKLALNGKEMTLKSGSVYHDHEMSDLGIKGHDFVGWDWLGVQFFDNKELIGFQMRKNNSTPFLYGAKSLTEVDPDGCYTASTQPESFLMEPLEFWTLKSGIKYPSKYKVTANRHVFYVVPIAKQAEMLHLGRVYGWVEVAADACEDIDCKNKIGFGFFEAVGYGGGFWHFTRALNPSIYPFPFM